MRRASLLIQLNACAILLVALAFTFSACVKRSRSQETQISKPLASPSINSPIPGQTNAPRININTASAADLEKLPGIGPALASRIIEHREKYGPFRRPEHLIIVRGISERRFRALQNLITVE